MPIDPTGKKGGDIPPKVEALSRKAQRQKKKEAAKGSSGSGEQPSDRMLYAARSTDAGKKRSPLVASSDGNKGTQPSAPSAKPKMIPPVPEELLPTRAKIDLNSLPEPIDVDDVRRVFQSLGLDGASDLSIEELRHIGASLLQGIFGPFPWTGYLHLGEPEIMGEQWVRRFTMMPIDAMQKTDGTKLSEDQLIEIAKLFKTGMMEQAFDAEEDYPESIRAFVPEPLTSYKGPASRRWRLAEQPTNPPRTLQLVNQAALIGERAAIERKDATVVAHHSWAQWTSGEVHEVHAKPHTPHRACKFHLLGLDPEIAMAMTHRDLDSMLDQLSTCAADKHDIAITHWQPYGDEERKGSHALIQRSSAWALAALADANDAAAARIVGTRPFPIVCDLAAFDRKSGILTSEMVAATLAHLLPRLRSKDLEPNNAVTAACAGAHLVMRAIESEFGPAKSLHTRHQEGAAKVVTKPDGPKPPTFSSRARQEYREQGMVYGILYAGIAQYLHENQKNIKEKQDAFTEAGTSLATLLATLPTAFHVPVALVVVGPAVELVSRPIVKKIVEHFLKEPNEAGWYKAIMAVVHGTLRLPDVPIDATREFVEGVNISMEIVSGGYGRYKTMVTEYRKHNKINALRKLFLAMQS